MGKKLKWIPRTGGTEGPGSGIGGAGVGSTGGHSGFGFGAGVSSGDR